MQARLWPVGWRGCTAIACTRSASSTPCASACECQQHAGACAVSLPGQGTKVCLPSRNAPAAGSCRSCCPTSCTARRAGGACTSEWGRCGVRASQPPQPHLIDAHLYCLSCPVSPAAWWTTSRRAACTLPATSCTSAPPSRAASSGATSTCGEPPRVACLCAWRCTALAASESAIRHSVAHCRRPDPLDAGPRTWHPAAWCC